MLLVIPFCIKDCKSAWKNITWAHELEGKLPFDCLLAYDSDVPEPEVKKIDEVARHTFKTVSHLPYPEWMGNPSWPNPQNYAFQTISWHVINNLKQPFLFWEPDAIPIREKWAHDIADSYAACGKPFLGHIVHGAFADNSMHLNGVAVYPPNLHEYSTAMMIPPEGLAWDVAGANGVVQNARHTSLIMNVWEIDGGNKIVRSGGIVPSFPDQKVVEAVVDFEAALFHRCKDGSLVDQLRIRRGTKSKSKPMKQRSRKKASV